MLNCLSTPPVLIPNAFRVPVARQSDDLASKANLRTEVLPPGGRKLRSNPRLDAPRQGHGSECVARRLWEDLRRELAAADGRCCRPVAALPGLAAAAAAEACA